MQTEVLLKNGLGIRVRPRASTSWRADGRRVLEHGGEVSGFTAENVVFPDDRAAITVLVNQDASGASGAIARKIAALLFAKDGAGRGRGARAADPGGPPEGLDRPDALHVQREQLLHRAGDPGLCHGPRAARRRPKGIAQSRSNDRGGMTFRLFEVTYPGKDARDLGARHARRQDRAVPGDGGGVGTRGTTASSCVRLVPSHGPSHPETFGSGFRSNTGGRAGREDECGR